MAILYTSYQVESFEYTHLQTFDYWYLEIIFHFSKFNTIIVDQRIMNYIFQKQNRRRLEFGTSFVSAKM